MEMVSGGNFHSSGGRLDPPICRIESIEVAEWLNARVVQSCQDR